VTRSRTTLTKVPAVTLFFWILKIAATTLGETGGDALSMSMNLGYLVATVIFAGMFLAVLTAQIRVKTFHPLLYWGTIIATTTVGTTMADFADRSLGLGYAGGSAILLVLLGASLFTWQHACGSLSVDSIRNPKAERYYWVTILFSQTLGTALGDWTADSAGLGYRGGAGGRAGRFSRQTSGLRGSGPQPLHRVGSSVRLHPGLPFVLQADGR